MYSEESMAPLPGYVHRIPVVRRVFGSIEDRYREATGKPFDYGNAFWTPPLPPHAAFAREQEQIQRHLGLAAHVSLTDHDSIQAGIQLHLIESSQGTPVSLEWTVPFEPSFLHIGVHNLPPAAAAGWLGRLRAYTAAPRLERLKDLLAGVSAIEGALVVLNHPLWDESRIGADGQYRMVRSFLSVCGGWIHAMEWNGLRPAAENRAVLEMAAGLDIPVVSGGDSHASAPSSVLNLTNASNFAEFAGEIRHDRVSRILLLPEYYGPHGLRYAECALDIVREYPDLAGRRRWVDRAFYREPDGAVQPLSSFCARDGGYPGAWPFQVLRLGHSRPFRAALRAALAACQHPAWASER